VYYKALQDIMSTHQINIKVSSDDLNFIDAKAKRYGLSRSAMIKLFALNAEMKVIVSGEMRQPKL